MVQKNLLAIALVAVVAHSVKLGEAQTRNKDCLSVYHEANMVQP